MSSLFDVDGSHVAQLNDSDLRSLVARLCEAELTCVGFPASAVTAGGDQDAADGGLDVRVALPSSAGLGGFVPRASTGFQVKVPEMPANAILKEMRPSGRVRPVIEELVRENGAYIIASAKASTSDSALRRRRQAMREAVQDVPGSEALAVDFYDREGSVAAFAGLRGSGRSGGPDEEDEAWREARSTRSRAGSSRPR